MLIAQDLGREAIDPDFDLLLPSKKVSRVVKAQRVGRNPLQNVSRYEVFLGDGAATVAKRRQIATVVPERSAANTDDTDRRFLPTGVTLPAARVRLLTATAGAVAVKETLRPRYRL